MTIKFAHPLKIIIYYPYNSHKICKPIARIQTFFLRNYSKKKEAKFHQEQNSIICRGSQKNRWPIFTKINQPFFGIKNDEKLCIQSVPVLLKTKMFKTFFFLLKGFVASAICVILNLKSDISDSQRGRLSAHKWLTYSCFFQLKFDNFKMRFSVKSDLWIYTKDKEKYLTCELVL